MAILMVPITHTTVTETIDPLADKRWSDFARSHPQAGPFHQCEWIRPIVKNFGFRTRFHVAVDRRGDIVAGLPLMLAESRLLGSRFVSLPFCHRVVPLDSDGAGVETLIDVALAEAAKRDLPLELRGWPDSACQPSGLVESKNFSRHLLDLSAGVDAVSRGLDKDVRYSVRRAEREGVRLRLADSSQDFGRFYELYVNLRRAQGLLPQPRRFVVSVCEEFVGAGKGFLVMAEVKGEPAAGLLTVTHGKQAVGTHSGSTPLARTSRATYAAMWRSIEEAIAKGMKSFDFGRSAAGAEGLEHFKGSWGATRVPLPYYFHPRPTGINAGEEAKLRKWAMKQFVQRAPFPVVEAGASLLYRHLG